MQRSRGRTLHALLGQSRTLRLQLREHIHIDETIPWVAQLSQPEDGQSNFLFFTRWERAIKEHGETVDDADAAWSLGKDIVTLGQTNQ